MLKGGIFLDMENLMRCGGWGMRYSAVKDLVSAQGVRVLRANAYMAIDRLRESGDPEYRRKKEGYRTAIRGAGFHLVLKEVKRYRDSEGELYMKANADLDLAVDVLLQSENLDYVLLGSGDGDFLRLVRAIQSRGKRIDLISFSNTSTELRGEVDYYFSGYLVPGVLPSPGDKVRMRGIMHYVNEEKGYGFLTVRTGYGVTDVRDDVFCHITKVSLNGRDLTNEEFAQLKTRDAVLEFDMVHQDDGKLMATNVSEFVPNIGDSSSS